MRIINPTLAAGASDRTASEILEIADRAYIGEDHVSSVYDDSSANAADRVIPAGASWVFDATLNRYAIEFDGTSGIPVGPLPVFGTAAGSKVGGALWAQLYSTGSEKRALSFNEEGNPPFQLLRLASLSQTSAAMVINGSNTVSVTGLTLTNWNHFAWLATSGGTLEFFVNGASVGTTGIGTFTRPSTNGAYVGAARNNTFQMVGKIADVLISDELTAEQIAWLANPTNRLLA